MIDLSILNNYPNVQRYVADYIETEGASPDGTRLPNLIIWIRETLEKNGVDVPNFFEWEEDWAEDFHSWGRNSRWGVTFRNWLSFDELEYHLETIANIAEEYGDPDIEEIYPVKSKD